MNEIEKTLLRHHYNDEHLRKQVHIYKRTKKKRIQNKAITKLLKAYLRENNASVYGTVASKNGRYFVILEGFEYNTQEA